MALVGFVVQAALVLIMALVGFVMQATLEPLPDAVISANKLELTLIIIACVISVVALAGALSAILLLAVIAFLLGLGSRLLLRP